MIDVENAYFDAMPSLVGYSLIFVAVVMFIKFRSFLITLTELITLAFSMSWTCGLMVIDTPTSRNPCKLSPFLILQVVTYQPGIVKDYLSLIFPSLASSSGLYWLVPALVYIVLTALSLEQNMYLFSIFTEFRDR